MGEKDYILAIDQGTTGSTAILFDREGQPVSPAYQEVCQIYTQPGWVEHDPKELFSASIAVAHDSLQKAGVATSQVKSIGITNQRRLL